MAQKRLGPTGPLNLIRMCSSICFGVREYRVFRTSLSILRIRSASLDPTISKIIYLDDEKQF